MNKEEKLLVALKNQYQGSEIFKYNDFFIVKEKNCDTNKCEYHLFGISLMSGFICTFPSIKTAFNFVNQLEGI